MKINDAIRFIYNNRFNIITRENSDYMIMKIQDKLYKYYQAYDKPGVTFTDKLEPYSLVNEIEDSQFNDWIVIR
jgi:hypothetical protein